MLSLISSLWRDTVVLRVPCLIQTDFGTQEEVTRDTKVKARVIRKRKTYVDNPIVREEDSKYTLITYVDAPIKEGMTILYGCEEYICSKPFLYTYHMEVDIC